jgi:hypothetical protein
MTKASRVDPRAQALKDLLTTINNFPRRAKEFLLGNSENQQHLADAFHFPPEQLAPTSDEQIRRLVQWLLLSLFVTNYQKATRENHFLLGLLFFWHTYLVPVAASRSTPPLSRVVAYVALPTNLEEFAREAQRWAKFAYADDPQTLRAILPLLIPEHFRKTLLVGIPANPTDTERRTFGNYLNLAAREVALRIEAIVLDAFSPRRQMNQVALSQTEPSPSSGKISVEVRPPSRLNWIAGELVRICFRLPAIDGDCLRADGYLERSLPFRSLRGQPRLPAFIKGSSTKVEAMSGFISGVLGSGRTAWMKWLTYQYSRVFLHYPDAPLAVYFSALDFVVHARNRRSVNDFITDELIARAGRAEDMQFLPEELRRLDRAGKLLLLVDDLDRLSDADQVEVMTQLTFSPAVVFAVLPWQVDKLLLQCKRTHIGLLALPPLSEQERGTLVDRLYANPHYGFDLETVDQLFQDLPDLSRSPLGIVVILEEANREWTEATQVCEAALQEYARRAGLPPAPIGIYAAGEIAQEWRYLFSAAHDLIIRMRMKKNPHEELQGEPNVVITKFIVENPSGHAWKMPWADVERTGLFRPVRHGSDEGLAIINRDLTCFLMALSAQHGRGTLVLPVY